MSIIKDMPRVAVVYLARIAHGVDGFKPFVDSYRKFPAGYPHDLILLGKGMTRPEDKAATSALFDEIPHRVIEMSDDGYDIHAYLKTAKLLDHDFVFFCNTYTEVASPDWLGKMMNLAIQPNVGIVGTTASYESLSTSIVLYNKLGWLVTVKRIRYNSALADQFRDWLEPHATKWIAARKSVAKRVKRAIRDIWHKRPPLSPKLERDFDAFWYATKLETPSRETLDQFDTFPNPHIRSTSFLISRPLLVSLDFNPAETKMACCLFECGRDGLSRKLMDRGLDLVLAGADGRGYRVEEWPESRTFRQGQQENLLTQDNHTKAYASFDPKSQELHSRISWGDYLLPAGPGFVSLGIEFPKAKSLRRSHSEKTQNGPKSYSIVIPTHNRLELVKDAIETVRRQSYQDWELVVYDNASSEPLAEHIASLADPRIRFKRSERFLPVTESWNNAIDEATGDYVMLFGDDDGLKPGFFERLNDLIEQFKQPEVIYSSILQFFHPGVAPWQPEGYVSEVRNGFFFQHREEPFLLDNTAKRRAVAGSIGIRRNFGFNMQSFVFKREFLDSIRTKGKVFQSPFPDYFLANVVFSLADTIVIVPESLAIAGVSKASFGFTLFNGLEKKGAALLNSDFDGDTAFHALKDELLPGPAYNSNYIMTMDHVARRLYGDTSTVRPDVGRYRKMQMLQIIIASEGGEHWLKSDAGSEAWKRLKIREKIWAMRVSTLRPPLFRQKRLERVSRDLNMQSFGPVVVPKAVGGVSTTMQLFEALERGSL